MDYRKNAFKDERPLEAAGMREIRCADPAHSKHVLEPDWSDRVLAYTDGDRLDGYACEACARLRPAPSVSEADKMRIALAATLNLEHDDPLVEALVAARAPR